MAHRVAAGSPLPILTGAEDNRGVDRDEGQTESMGARIRRLRIAKGYTLTKFAEVLKKNMATLSRIETNKEKPGVKTIYEIAKALGEDPIYIYTGRTMAEAWDAANTMEERIEILRYSKGFTKDEFRKYVGFGSRGPSKRIYNIAIKFGIEPSRLYTGKPLLQALLEAETLGERIALLRISKGLTQAKLAEVLEVDHLSISNWESNKNIPQQENLLNLAEYVNITPGLLTHRFRKAVDLSFRPTGYNFAESRFYELKRWMEEISIAVFEAIGRLPESPLIESLIDLDRVPAHLISNAVDAIIERMDLHDIDNVAAEVSFELFIADDGDTFVLVLSDNGAGIREGDLKGWVNKMYKSTARDNYKQVFSDEMHFLGRWGDGMKETFAVLNSYRLHMLIETKRKNNPGYRLLSKLGEKNRLSECNRDSVGTTVVIATTKRLSQGRGTNDRIQTTEGVITPISHVVIDIISSSA